MILEQILQAVFEDGCRYQDFSSTSHLPETPHIDDEMLRKADEVISEHLAVDQAGWDDFSIYPANVWEQMKRNAFAAGVQGRESYADALDVFGYDNPEMFAKELACLNGFLNKSVVLQPVHLGTGEQGIMRRIALDNLAAAAGCWWNESPSVGRWLVKLADDKIGSAI